MKGNFQIIILVVFIITAVLGVLVFSGAIPIGKDNTGSGGAGTIVLWGTVSNQTMSTIVDNFNHANTSFVLKYEEKSVDTFDSELLEAMASGTGPDMFFITDDIVYKYNNKIFKIPYTSYPINNFKNNFIGASEVFLTSKGILAFPLVVDPLMMYYNRSLLDASQVVLPPTYWDELVNMVSLLNKKDDKGLLTKSAVALGQFSNVTNSKDILATLFMQTGNPIVVEKNGFFTSVLNNTGSNNNAQYIPDTVLKFYTDFADPLKDVYSWNKSFNNSRDAFSSENLALYFGFASELQSLINKNPNQNFLVTSIPQIRNGNFKLTSGRVMGVALSSFSKNFNTAFIAASLMSSGDFASQLSTALSLPPVRRDLLNKVPTDEYMPIFYKSALFAKSWFDPSPKDTNIIFQGMVEKVLSNSMTTESAMEDANTKMQLLLAK